MYKNVVTTSLRAGTRNTLARGTRYTNAVRNTHACAQRNAVRAAQGNSILRVAVKAGWKSAVGLGCLVGFGALAPIFCDEPVDTSKVKETSTGIEFPTKLEGPLYGNLSLCGFGVRYVTFLKFKVYAVGLYVDMASAKKVVGNTTDGNEAMQKVLDIHKQ